ncbi:Murein L,D-transpeptidase YcbB/YkuD [Pedobacter antarcticus]|nr:Murein L,D-transpeptidase YcbB/YkuD [Pedobacter antarcticus]
MSFLLKFSILSTMRLKFIVIAPLLFLFIQCQQKPENKVIRDTSITPVNAVTKLYTDSLDMEKFISSQQLDDSAANRMRNFYNSRNFQFAWFSEKGLAEQTKVLYDLDKNFRSSNGDSSVTLKNLQTRIDHLLTIDTVIKKADTSLTLLEFNLTSHFFSFITDAYAGKVDPAKLQWYIPRKKIDAVAVLDSLVKNKGNDTNGNAPLNSYYVTLNKELSHWSAIAKKGSWPDLEFAALQKLKPGDSSAIISTLKTRLAAFGALAPTDSSGLYTLAVDTALRLAQQQFGQQVTGKLTASLVKSLNIPVRKRIEQILINLERMRWVPVMPEGRVILVNIPEYKLHIFEDRKEVLNMGIVVGKEAHQTVIFSNTLKNIVFSPYWNVPPSIVKAEILPAINRNKNYLAQHQMEIYGKSGGLPLIRQKPGSTNSLGRVKFLFPNSYNIYLHDTPAKSLFTEQKRAFSHGCIRLSQPKTLAEYLLENDPSWTKEKITKAMQQSKETWVQVKQPVPVFITYFTAWVDKNGLLNFRDDVYGHDSKMAALLFPQTPAARKAVGADDSKINQ